MLARALTTISAEDYRRWERQAEGRSEYQAGQIFAMAGASRRHNRIVTNLSSALNVQLQSRPCNNYLSDMRVRIGNAERYVYPDIVATCGREEAVSEATRAGFTGPPLFRGLPQTTGWSLAG